MQGFSGFKPEEGSVPVPAGFFAELLPAITELGELKLTLYLLQARVAAEKPPLFSLKALSELPDLMAALEAGASRSALDTLRRALERAAARGTLLHVVATRGDATRDFYLINDEAGRELAAAIEAGRLDEADWEGAAEPAAWRVERPNIFVLYEQNIGMLQPLIVEELREAEQRYPLAWIEEAFRLAAERNARNWRYVRSILERWAREGKGDERGPGFNRRQYIEGEYGQFVKH
jgi:DNA replication protein